MNMQYIFVEILFVFVVSSFAVVFNANDLEACVMHLSVRRVAQLPPPPHGEPPRAPKQAASAGHNGSVPTVENGRARQRQPSTPRSTASC